MRVPHHALLAALAAVLCFSCLVPVPPRMVTLFKDSSLPGGNARGRPGEPHDAAGEDRPDDRGRVRASRAAFRYYAAGYRLPAGRGCGHDDGRITAAAADTWQKISLDARLPVPLLLAAGVVGSTRFPSAAGLAASLDPRLAKAVGRASADELAAAGIRWSLDSDLGMDDAQSSILATVEVSEGRHGRCRPGTAESCAGSWRAGDQGPHGAPIGSWSPRW